MELWEELGDKYYLISPINDLAVRVSFAEDRQGSRVALGCTGGPEGRPGVPQPHWCSGGPHFGALDPHVKPETQLLVPFQVTNSGPRGLT